MKLKAAFTMVVTLLVFNQFAFAHSLANVPPSKLNGSIGTLHNSLPAVAGKGVNLDLTSTLSTLSAGPFGLNGALNIRVGSKVESVGPASILTPAEFLAAYQVANTGMQSLKLSAQGDATGGTFSIPLSLSNSLVDLVIPKGVKLFDNAAITPTVNLSGDIIDSGKMVVLSTNPQISAAVFDAANIYVQPGGVLAASVDLTLNAQNNIANSGTIASAGNLNLHSVSGNFSNSGTISAFNGNINIISASDITFNNAGGTLSAPSGAINFRDPSYHGSANLTLNGGNYLSQSLNLYSGTGSVNMNVGQVSGIVNTYAASAHLDANTANLQIGTFAVSGDPWINSSGNLDLGGTITGPLAYLVATAGGSISTSVSGQSIDTSAAGGNVVLAAGVTATDTDGSISFVRSGQGGDVILATGQTIDGNSTQDIQAFTTGGGNVTIIAVTDGVQNSTNGGHVILPGALIINTAGATAGNISVFAEASAGSIAAVNLGGLNAGTGSVDIQSGTANLANGTIGAENGAVTGSFNGGSLQNGSLTLSHVSSTSQFTASTNGTISFSGANLAGSAILAASEVNIQNSGTFSTSAGDLLISAAVSNLTITADTSPNNGFRATGGTLTISAGSNGVLLFNCQTPGSAANINLDSSVGVNLLSGTQITVDQRVSLANSNSAGTWTIDAPTVQLNDGASMSGFNGHAGLVLHANDLTLGAALGGQANISGTSVTIDDNCQSCVAGSGLTLNENTSTSLFPIIFATNGMLTISANANGASLIFASGGFALESNIGVALSAVAGISLNASVTAENPNGKLADGFSLTAPVINSEFGFSSINSGLQIHTNALNVGNNLNQITISILASSIVIDANLPNSDGNLSILGVDGVAEQFQAGSVSINAAGGVLLGSSPGNSPDTFAFQGQGGVAVSGSNITMAGNLTFTSNGQISLSAASALTLSNLSSQSGNITAISTASTGGVISVLSNSTILTVNGNITIANESTSGGSIIVGNNVVLTAAGAQNSEGNVQITVGGTTTVAGKAPAYVQTIKAANGKTYFGTNGISADAPNNKICASGRKIIFNTALLPASSITLEGGDVIAAGAPVLTSLDLTNEGVIQLIEAYQSEKVIPGNLRADGTIMLSPMNLPIPLTAENIPSGDAVTLVNFTAATPLTINVSSASGTNEVTINGAEKIIGNTGINISGASPGEHFNLGKTGSLTCSGNLALNISGNASFTGTIFSPELTISTQPDSAGDADITVSGSLGSSKSNVVLSVGGSGSIVQGTPSAFVLGKSISLEADLGNIGSPSGLQTTTLSLFVTTSISGNGGAVVYNSESMILNNSSLGGGLALYVIGNLTVNSIMATRTVTALTSGKLAVHAGSQISCADGAVVLAAVKVAANAITIGANTTISATGPSDPGASPALYTPGNVTIVVGTSSDSLGGTPKPIPNVKYNETNNGQIGAGFGLIATKSLNTINADAAYVTLATSNSSLYNVILLKGGVTISGQTVSASYSEGYSSAENVVDTGDCDF